MTRLIVEVDEGDVVGIYTDFPMHVRIKDSDNRKKESESLEYFKLKRIIEQGCVENILHQGPTAETEPTDVPIMLNPDVFLIIMEPNMAKTDTGKQLQRLLAAYTDGYLKAQAELFQFTMKLMRSKSEDDKQNGKTLLKVLEPLRDKQDANYNALCEYINQPDIHDDQQQ